MCLTELENFIQKFLKKRESVNIWIFSFFTDKKNVYTLAYLSKSFVFIMEKLAFLYDILCFHMISFIHREKVYVKLLVFAWEKV